MKCDSNSKINALTSGAFASTFKHTTVKPVSNDHLYDNIYYLRFIQWSVLMKTEGTNLLLVTISAYWSSSTWPMAT